MLRWSVCEGSSLLRFPDSHQLLSAPRSTAACWPLAPLVLLLWLSVVAVADDTAASYACALRPDIVGRCFTVRGRLSFWNGAPSARIWPVGTKRLLGIHSDVLPPSLLEKVDSFDPADRFDTEAWALFTVCPFTRAKRGHMQFVCIESWRDLRLRHR